MPGYANLPEEILLMIFRSLGYDNLLECHKVCRSWYTPARLTMLKAVSFRKAVNIERFNSTIDLNPDPLYLSAVKYITFLNPNDLTHDYYEVSLKTVEKLFCRFPNLKDVWIYNYTPMFDAFNDEVCDKILACCPKLGEFRVDPGCEDLRNYCSLVHRLRKLVTWINLDEIRPFEADKHGGIVKLITSCTRLEEITGSNIELANFYEWLPILDGSPTLKQFFVHSTRGDDEEDFAEDYIAVKSKEEREVFKKRLSGIKKLRLKSDDIFIQNSLQFVKRYLTGLEFIRLVNEHTLEWTELRQRIFFTTILDLICNNEGGRVELRSMYMNEVATHLPKIVDKFTQSTNTVNRTLELYLCDTGLYNWVDLDLLNKKSGRKIKLSFSNEIKARFVVESLFKSGPLTQIDEFILSSCKCSAIADTFVDTCDSIFKQLPYVKNVTLSIPAAYEDRKPTTAVNAHPQIEHLSLKAANDLAIQALLNRYYFTFPNLKRLDFYFYSGEFDARRGKFQIKLPKYSLEHLTLDTTPLLNKMKKDLKKKLRIGEDYFVLELNIFGRGERNLYKIKLDLSKITSINDTELDRNDKYYRIHINIKSLKKLELCLSKFEMVDTDDLLYMDGMTRIIVFGK